MSHEPWYHVKDNNLNCHLSKFDIQRVFVNTHWNLVVATLKPVFNYLPLPHKEYWIFSLISNFCYHMSVLSSYTYSLSSSSHHVICESFCGYMFFFSVWLQFFCAPKHLYINKSVIFRPWPHKYYTENFSLKLFVNNCYCRSKKSCPILFNS